MTDEILNTRIKKSIRDAVNSIDVELGEAAMPLRAQLLREAEEITCGDRHMDYGDPVENHWRIARIASEATGHRLTAHDVVMVLIAAKMARARISPTKRDHYVDMMAYAGIAYECADDEDRDEGDDDDSRDLYSWADITLGKRDA